MKKGKRKSTGSIIIAWIIFLLFIINMIPIVEGHATAPDYSYVKTDDWHLNLTAHPEFNIGGLGVFDFIIDSKGNYYYQSSNSVRKSTDGGKTWNVVLFGIYSGGLNCLSDDTLIATGQKGNVAKVWISRDYGANWINHLNTTTGQIWNSIGISSSPNGDIFIGEYAQGNEKGRYLYRSYDHGLTWNSTNISNYMWTLDWANFNHIHTVFSAGNNELYVTIGDGRQTPVRQTLKSIDRGVTFSTISTADAWTGMIKVNGSFYMGSDSGGGIWKTSDWIDWDCKMWNQLRDTDTFGWLSALEYDNKNNVMYAATSSGTTSNAIGIENIIMCSPDMGDHWGVLYKSNLSIKSVNFDPLHQKIWFVTFDHEAYEISTLTNNEARHLIGNYRVESYNIETHFLTDRGNAWLSNYEKPLKNVTVTITPVAQNNLLTNPSFENDSEGWNVDKGSSIIFDATSPFGQHVARITNGTQKIQSKAWLAVDPSTQYIGSVYCKNIGMVNTTNPSLIMYVQEYTDQYAFIRRDSLGSYAINIQEWIRFAKNITTDPSCHFIRFYLTCSDQREIAGTYFLFDGAMLVKSEMITPFVIGNQGMINYTVDIDGQKFSGTNIKSQSTHVFQGILAGLTCINATMNGSRLATIEIRGEQIVRGDGILFDRFDKNTIGFVEFLNGTKEFTVLKSGSFAIGELFNSSGIMRIDCDHELRLEFVNWNLNRSPGIEWIANTSLSDSVKEIYSISDLTPKDAYSFIVDGAIHNNYTEVDSNGTLTLTYLGSGLHSFEILRTPNIYNSSDSLIFLVLASIILIVSLFAILAIKSRRTGN